MVRSASTRAIGALIVALLGVIADSTAAGSSQAGCFRIFDATLFTGKPDLSAYGIEKSTVIYAEHHFWPQKQTKYELPARDAVRSTLHSLVTSRPPVPPLVILDLEHWPNVGSDETVASSVRKYVRLLNWTKQELPQSQVGYYGVPPLRDYWRAVKGLSSLPYRDWQYENDRFLDLAMAADVLLPSLYTFYDDPDGWELYAVANLNEARRLAGDKPVYPFIWPQYHDSNAKIGMKYLPGEVWLRQLRLLEQHADGVVIWANPQPWNGRREWWQATRRFINTSSRVCR